MMYTLYWKAIKTSKFEKIVSMKSQAELIKKSRKYANQVALDNQISIGTINMVIVNDKNKITWFDIGYTFDQLKQIPALYTVFLKSIKRSGFSLDKKLEDTLKKEKIAAAIKIIINSE